MKELSHTNQIVIVIGLGSSGIGAARFLNYNHKNVIVFEKSQEESFNEITQSLRAEGIQIEFNKPLTFASFKSYLSNLSAIVISPGIPWDHKTINQLREEKITVTSEVAIAWEKLHSIPWVGVTGTNGKTTVTRMLDHVINNSGLTSNVGANVGKAASELALAFQKDPTKKPQWLIMELSSYQIESAPKVSPQIGIWTTLTPDHLERHGSMENYISIKRGLLEKSSTRIYNADDKYLEKHRADLPGGKWVSTKGPGSSTFPNDLWLSSEGVLMENNEALFNSNILHLKGDHNLQNLLLVTAAAREIGLSKEQIGYGINTFKSIPHRLERIDNNKQLEILNDSKATNFDSANIGLKATSKPTILIAGGRLKKGNSSDWLTSIKERASVVILFGESRMQLKSLIEKSGFNGQIHCYSSLNLAVSKAVKVSQSLNAKSILFSPACASFDLYKNFEERGNHFRELIKEAVN